jgi:endonuclease G, mitochondrial
MTQLDPNELSDLLDQLLKVPNIVSPAIRDALLFTLPTSVLVQIGRQPQAASDLAAILTTTEQWGLLADGRWATDIVLRNAARTVNGSPLEAGFESLRQRYALAADDGDLTSNAEIVTGEVDWIMPASFLMIGAQRMKAVARLTVPRFFGSKPDLAGTVHRAGVGTGWMIAPALLMTNEHVVSSRFKTDPDQIATAPDRMLQAGAMTAWFGYLNDGQPEYSQYRMSKLETSSTDLDYALLRVDTHDSRRGIALSDWGFLPLERSTYRPAQGNPLNIIQHPGGDPQRVTLRRNDYVRDTLKNGRFLYLTDTRPGSSGSPVFHDDWRVVGLHRASRPVWRTKAKGERIKHNNEGVWLSNIIADLPASLRAEVLQHQPHFALP